MPDQIVFHKRTPDVTGYVYGRLTVKAFAGYRTRPSPGRVAMWECVCTCGNVIVTKASSLKDGLSRSCGCLSVEKFVERNRIYAGTRRVVSGPSHPGWKGDQVGLGSLHDWVRRHRGTPSECEHCGKTEGLFQWANKSGEYKRDLADWLRLCVPCHFKYDDIGRKMWATRKGQAYVPA